LFNPLWNGYYNKLFIVKLDSSGNYSWANSNESNGIFVSFGNSLISDNNDNIYVTGSFDYDNISFGNDTLNTAGLFIVKYDHSGTVQWAKCSDANGYSEGFCIKLDINNNIFVCGLYQDSLTIGNTTLSGIPNMHTSFIVKYDSYGNKIWLKGTNANYNYYYGNGFTIDYEGSIFIIGSFDDTIIGFDNDTLVNCNSTGSSADIFIAKLGPDLSVGIFSLAEDEKLQVFIYPVPAGNEIHIKVPQKSEIEIFNIEGQCMMKIISEDNTTTFDISAFAPGMYFAKVKTEAGMAVRKFVKE
jgi:hypothetical protein